MTTTSESQRAALDPQQALDAVLEHLVIELKDDKGRVLIELYPELAQVRDAFASARQEIIEIADLVKQGRGAEARTALRLSFFQHNLLLSRIEGLREPLTLEGMAAVYGWYSSMYRAARFICLIVSKQDPAPKSATPASPPLRPTEF